MSTPTERAALDLIEGRQDDDPQGRALARIASAIEIIEHANDLVQNNTDMAIIELLLRTKGEAETDGFLDTLVGGAT